MKKIASLLIMIAMIIGLTTVVKAADATIIINASPDPVAPGQEVKVTIDVKDFTRNGDNKAIEAKISYDANVLEYKSKTAGSGWNVTSSDGTSIVASKGETVSAQESVVTLVYTVKSSTTEKNTIISVTDILTSSDGDEESAKDVSKSITIEKKSEEKPSNPKDDPNSNQDNDDNSGNNDNNKDNEYKEQEEKKPTSAETEKENKKTTDDTQAKTNYPNTGIKRVVFSVLVLIIIAIVTYIGYRKNKI